MKKKSKTDGALSATKIKIAELTAKLKRLKDAKATRAQDEQDEKVKRERERLARLVDGRIISREERPSPIKADLEEVRKVEDELDEVLGQVPELENSSSDENMSPIRAQIKKEIREVKKVRDELEIVLGEVPDVESDESLSPIKPT